MWVDELVRAGVSLAEHAAEEAYSRIWVAVRGVRGDHGGVEVDVRCGVTVEDAAGVTEVGHGNGAETEEFEGVELILAMTMD